jgi:hypothetical protein
LTPTPTANGAQMKYFYKNFPSYKPLVVSVYLDSPQNPYGICGGQSGSGTGFALMLRFYSVTIVSLSSPVRRNNSNLTR